MRGDFADSLVMERRCDRCGRSRWPLRWAVDGPRGAGLAARAAPAWEPHGERRADQADTGQGQVRVGFPDLTRKSEREPGMQVAPAGMTTAVQR